MESDSCNFVSCQLSSTWFLHVIKLLLLPPTLLTYMGRAKASTLVPYVSKTVGTHNDPRLSDVRIRQKKKGKKKQAVLGIQSSLSRQCSTTEL